MALPRFLRWALEANYPAGGDPWASMPTKVEPGILKGVRAKEQLRKDVSAAASASGNPGRKPKA